MVHPKKLLGFSMIFPQKNHPASLRISPGKSPSLRDWSARSVAEVPAELTINTRVLVALEGEDPLLGGGNGGFLRLLCYPW